MPACVDWLGPGSVTLSPRPASLPAPPAGGGALAAPAGLFLALPGAKIGLLTSDQKSEGEALGPLADRAASPKRRPLVLLPLSLPCHPLPYPPPPPHSHLQDSGRPSPLHGAAERAIGRVACRGPAPPAPVAHAVRPEPGPLPPSPAVLQGPFGSLGLFLK